MFQQPMDFKEESDALYAILKDRTDEELEQKTQFKDWTINQVVTHLHLWNQAADFSMQNETAFDAFMNDVMKYIQGGLRVFEDQRIGELKGRALVDEWHSFYLEFADRVAQEDPKRRVKWAGPSMSVISSITARLMETWAHGQEVFDILGIVREDKDRIKNIAVLGINTFGWTYKNRKMDVPEFVPYVKLTAPSGAIWEWNDASCGNSVEGRATEFCQVVTQARNIEDTDLVVSGPVATEWMSIAQCFAGAVETPPAKGHRHTVEA